MIGYFLVTICIAKLIIPLSSVCCEDKNDFKCINSQYAKYKPQYNIIKHFLKSINCIDVRMIMLVILQ